MVAVGAAGLVVFTLARGPVDVPEVPGTGHVSKGNLQATVSATGSLNALTTVNVGSQVSGTIEHLYVDFNSPVTKGEKIARIEASLFKAQVAQARANHQSAEAALESARVQLNDALRQLERTRRMHAQHLTPDAEFDVVRFAADRARAEFRVRESALAQAEAALTLAQVNLEHATIYAPIDGVVISRDVDVGQTVAASLQAPTLFTIARDLTHMQIETEVDEAFIGSIREGQPVTFTVFAYPDRTFSGTVAQVRLNPTVEAGVVKYNCVIHVDNPDLSLKPGMTATVSIVTASVENALLVPNAALRFVPDWPRERLETVRKHLKRGQGVLWLPTGADFTPLVVSLGLAGESLTAVTGDGLEEGLTVAMPQNRPEGRPGRRRPLRLF